MIVMPTIEEWARDTLVDIAEGEEGVSDNLWAKADTDWPQLESYAQALLLAHAEEYLESLLDCVDWRAMAAFLSQRIAPDSEEAQRAAIHAIR